MKTFLKIIFSLCVLGATACGESYFSYEDNYYRINVLGEVPQDQVDFGIIQANILTPHCTECHKRFDDYEAVKTRLGAIQNSITENRMPKNAPPLSPREKELLNLWVLNGAPLSLTESVD